MTITPTLRPTRAVDPYEAPATAVVFHVIWALSLTEEPPESPAGTDDESWRAGFDYIRGLLADRLEVLDPERAYRARLARTLDITLKDRFAAMLEGANGRWAEAPPTRASVAAEQYRLTAVEAGLTELVTFIAVLREAATLEARRELGLPPGPTTPEGERGLVGAASRMSHALQDYAYALHGHAALWQQRIQVATEEPTGLGASQRADLPSPEDRPLKG
jgi:hypothetical protein